MLTHNVLSRIALAAHDLRANFAATSASARDLIMLFVRHIAVPALGPTPVSPADAILEAAATQAVDNLLLGTTQRGVLWRAMKGDVIQRVAAHLLERITLLVHAG